MWIQLFHVNLRKIQNHKIMTSVSINDFNTYTKKYLDLAVNEDVCIENDKYRFHLICEPVKNEIIPEQVILKPDDDLHSAITADEFKKRCLNVIDKIFNQ